MLTLIPSFIGGPFGPRSRVAVVLLLAGLGACASNRNPGLYTVAELQRHEGVTASRIAPAAAPQGGLLAAAEYRAPAGDSTETVRVAAAGDTVLVAKGPTSASIGAPALHASAPEAAAPLPGVVLPEPEARAPLVAPNREPQARPDLVQGNWIRVDRIYPPLDFTLFGQPIANVASLIAEKSGQNIVLSDERDVREKQITGEIRGQPWHIALEALLEAHGLRAIQDLRTGIITVVTAERAGNDRRPFPIRLKYLYARDMLAPVQRILAVSDSSDNAVEVYGDEGSSRTLIAFASPDRLAQVEALVDSLDRRPARVSVEVRMAQVNRTAMETLGFSFSFVPMGGDNAESNTGVQVQQTGQMRSVSSDAGPAVQILRQLSGVGTIGLNAFIDAVSEAGMAETETTPLITANSGVTSEIMVGDAFILPNNQPILWGGGVYGGQMGPGGQPGQGQGQGGYGGYPGGQMGGGMGGGMGAGGFARFETGTSLKVTPHVMGENEISMAIELVRDGGNLSPDGRTITGGKQSAQTEVTVLNDTPIVIGGLTVNGRTRTDSGLPGLSKLPLVGRLFRREEFSTQYQDLIILVTPHIHEEARGNGGPVAVGGAQ